MIPITLSGDIGLTASKSFLSKAIRFFGRLQTGSADRSHAFSCIGDDQLIEALVRVRIHDLNKYKDQDVEIYRLPLVDEDRRNFRRGMLKIAGDSYGWGKIPLHAMDSLASVFARKPVFFFTAKFGVTAFKDCSQLTVFGLHHFTKYRLLDGNHKEVRWVSVSPDYLQDILNLPHNKAKMIYKQAAV